MALAPYCQGNERRWCRVCVVADTETTTTAEAATDDTAAAAAWKYPFGSCCESLHTWAIAASPRCVVPGVQNRSVQHGSVICTNKLQSIGNNITNACSWTHRIYSNRDA